MLYLDSSALVKVFIRESGSLRLGARMEQGDRICTSKFSFAEIHATFGRKLRENLISDKEFRDIRRSFSDDWKLKFVQLHVDSDTMTSIPDLIRVYPLRGADAIHLSCALWLRDAAGRGSPFASGDPAIEFGAADKRLVQVAAQCGLAIFDPEASI